jgi:Uma2 family endonuclease
MRTAVRDKPVAVPTWVEDLEAFRRWVRSDEVPEKGRISFLYGGVWLDMSKEQAFSHNQVKTQFAMKIGILVEQGRLGRFFGDGMRLSDPEADLSHVPDGIFVSKQSLQTGRVRLIEGAKEGFIELEGSPDMVLEVVSQSSVRKDLVILRDLYWQAGIREYWVVDARGERLRFDILRHAAKDYVATRKQAGWLCSEVFGKSFKLTAQRDDLGYPEYTLSVR